MPRFDRLMPLAAAATMLFVAACGDDEEDNINPAMDAGMADSGMPDTGPTDTGITGGNNIVQTAQQAGLTALLQAATTANLVSTLEGPGPFTVFAPTDAAFAALGSQAPTDPDLLANVLLTHVVPGQQDSTAVLGAQGFLTAASTTIAVDATAMPPTVGGAPLGMPLDVVASNGIVHVIDQVIVPPNIPAAVSATPDLSSLLAAVGQSSQTVQDALAAPGPITVFAPVNSAFAGINLSNLTQAQLDAILTYHVVSGQALSTDLTDGQVLTTANGGTIRVNVAADGNVTLTDAAGQTVRVISANIRLLNGVVHLVDTVLNPQAAQNIVELAQAAGLTSLVAAAQTAGLANTLQSVGPFTVFAPTNMAFQNLGNMAPTDPGLLANVLLNHVVPGIQDSTAVLAAQNFTTAAQTQIAVDATATPPTVGGAGLDTANIDQRASNGIVHVIDSVIVPPDIASAVSSISDLSTLTAAVQGAAPAVGTTLSGPGPITVFAPVNSAFTGLDVPALLMDQDRLTDILTYHVAQGQALSTDLTDGQVLTMANGANLRVNVSGNAVTLTDGLGQTVNVTQANIRLLNGTVHLIDGVLNPGTILEQAINARLNTLVASVNRVNLDGVLRGTGPFTVFAPTDAAFAAVPADLSQVNDAVIANILLHHVVPGRNDSTAVLAASQFLSAANLSLAVNSSATPPTVGGARLSNTLDVNANNGIVHVLSDVIVPPTIPQTAAAVPDLSIVVQALGLSSMATQMAVNPNTLGGDMPITVFAPLNNAFNTQGIDPATTPQTILDAVLGYHVVSGQVLSTDLTTGSQMVTTLAGGQLTINVAANGTITIVDATGGIGTVDVSLRDIRTLSGVVHVIDRVLQPN